jgi:hypothetical protein
MLLLTLGLVAAQATTEQRMYNSSTYHRSRDKDQACRVWRYKMQRRLEAANHCFAASLPLTPPVLALCGLFDSSIDSSVLLVVVLACDRRRGCGCCCCSAAPRCCCCCSPCRWHMSAGRTACRVRPRRFMSQLGPLMPQRYVVYSRHRAHWTPV